MAALIFILAASSIGCGGGNKMFSQQGGVIVSGELDLDSIPAPPEKDEYVIDYGDVLDIDFLYNSDYSRAGIKVRPDGKIAYPLVGEIKVAGMTVSRLDDILTERYSEIIVDPDITIIVSTFHDRLVYVLGEVRSPGGFPVAEVPTLLTALSQAGIRETARMNSVLVMRRTAPDSIVGIQIDLTQLTDDHRFDLDIPLRLNDIVYVPRSNLRKASDFTSALFAIIVQPMDVYLRGWRVWNAKTYYEFLSQRLDVQ